MFKVPAWFILLGFIGYTGWAATSSAPVSISGTVTVDGSGVTQPVSGTFWQATQPVSGTFWQATQPVSGTVTVNALTNSSVVKAQLQDNSGTAITVGQKAMSSSVPVVLSSDQTAIPVTLTPPFASRADTFTTTANGTTVDRSTNPLKSFTLAVKATGAVTSWTVVLECSLDNSNFTTVLTHTNATPADGQAMFSGTSLAPCLYFRSRASAITLGGGTNVIATILGM